MTRRIVRTATQLAVLTSAILLLVFILDNRYRVLPKVIHNHLPVHHEDQVITDITVNICRNPLSSCKLDPAEWTRIEKDVYLGDFWGKAYVHFKRRKEDDLTHEEKILLDVKITRKDPNLNDKGELSGKWESRPGGIWLRRTTRKHTTSFKNIVTAVDVLFGTDAADPRPSWELKEMPLLLDNANSDHMAHLSIRRGRPAKIERPSLRVREDSKFKIMQISDLHLSTGVGKCRDPEPPGYKGGECLADLRTFDFVLRVLEDEKPDLVVLSGDQVNGDTAPDSQSAIFKLADLLIKHKVPYAAIFGNHDDEGDLKRAASMSFLTTLPYSLSSAGPNTIEGVGNYYLEVMAHGSSHTALTLYFLDSHSYSPDERNFKGYDWIKPKQIEWFKDTSAALKASPSHKKYANIPMDMAFIHIPLPEYAFPTKDIVGQAPEGVTAPRFNSGFRDALVSQGVLAVSCGHDHANEYCALSRNKESSKPELWMCYAGGSGFGGYGGYGGYVRRIRVFEVDTGVARIRTWKRLEFGDIEKRIDEQMIVDGGKVKPPRTSD